MSRRKNQRRTGVAAVELAVCLPFLLILIAGLWEVGRMVQVQILVSNAAREGGRQAAAGLNNNATICQNVVNDLTMNGLTGVTISNVTLTNMTSGSRSNPQTANQMDQFQLTIAVPYSAIRWSTITQITPDAFVTCTTYWYSTLDSAATVSTVIPTS